MGKRISTLQEFYIDNNLGMSDVELVKTTGCSLQQVQARRLKIQGRNREGNLKGTPEQPLKPINAERQAELENQAQKAAVAAETKGSLEPITNQQRPAPAMRIDALIAKRGGTTSLTGPASELADMFDGIAPGSTPVVQKYDPFNDSTKVHRIKE
jgi:hypothetical protein